MVDSQEKLYKYTANSVHKGHICDCIIWRRGKVMAWCFHCNETFIGIARCMRKLNLTGGSDERNRGKHPVTDTGANAE